MTTTIEFINGAPPEMQDVMVFIGLSARLTNSKTIAETKGLDGFPKTETGKLILSIVQNAMRHTQYIRALPAEARQVWRALVADRYSVGFELQKLDGGYRARSVSAIVRNPTAEQKDLARRYTTIQASIVQFEMQPSMF